MVGQVLLLLLQAAKKIKGRHYWKLNPYHDQHQQRYVK
jgi:hypothetical protein